MTALPDPMSTSSSCRAGWGRTFTPKAVACLPICPGRTRSSPRFLALSWKDFDPGKFDAVLFCAAGLPSHRNSDHEHILNQIALGSLVQELSSNRQPVSEAVMTSVMEKVLYASANLEAIRVIRSAFSGRIVIQVCPLPSRALVAYRPESEKGSDLGLQYGDRVWSFLSWYYRQQISIISAFAGSLGARVILPADSFVEAGFSPNKYKTPDPWHMNTAYGRLTLKQALAELGVLQR